MHLLSPESSSEFYEAVHHKTPRMSHNVTSCLFSNFTRAKKNTSWLLWRRRVVSSFQATFLYFPRFSVAVLCYAFLVSSETAEKKHTRKFDTEDSRGSRCNPIKTIHTNTCAVAKVSYNQYWSPPLLILRVLRQASSHLKCFSRVGQAGCAGSEKRVWVKWNC